MPGVWPRDTAAEWMLVLSGVWLVKMQLGGVEMKRELSEDDIKLAIYRWLESYGAVDGSCGAEKFKVEFKKQTKLGLSDLDIKIGAEVVVKNGN